MRTRLRGKDNKRYRNREKDQMRRVERGRMRKEGRKGRGREATITPRSTSTTECGNKLIKAESRKAKLIKAACLEHLKVRNLKIVITAETKQQQSQKEQEHSRT